MIRVSKEVLILIEGISHLTFIVRDLERALAFFMSIFDAEEIYSSDMSTYSLSREKFILIGGQWVCIMEGDPLPGRTYNHVAFKINEAEFDLYASKVQAAGVEIKPSRPRVEGEGRSLYFYDFDNNLFELHTGSLTERLSRYNDQAG
jgi:fosfomycin resistance protein FosX